MAKAIKVEGLSKAYQLGDFGTGTISRDLERFWARMRGKEDPFLKIGETNDRTTKGESDIVWSLKDINFEIEQGDAVGIIGRNGAGKSTLLKILSRVTTPTTGSVKVKGRIASLLEVGTGFHPELTGRENIFLNGAILGMRKKEIKRKFDEIVDFAGVERYIDTPVKRYSSGMYVRLAFAVAAHLESEILIVDEVLAVGDAEFQKKCLGKMGDVSKGEGRTVLFVSHNMHSIKTLCNTGIVLRDGNLDLLGDIHSSVNWLQNSYATAYSQSNGEIDLKQHSQKIDPNIGLVKLQILENDRITNTVRSGEKVTFRLFYNLTEKLNNPEIGIVIKDSNEMPLIGLNNAHANQPIFNSQYNLNGYTDIIFQNFPIYGDDKYYINLYLGHINDAYEILENVTAIEVNKNDVYHSGKYLDQNFNKLYYKDILFKND